jgi:uncharacterized Tic20 family protein
MATARPRSKTTIESTETDRLYALLAHLGGFFGPLGWVVPVTVRVARGWSSSLVADQAREATNFQLLMLLAYTLVAVGAAYLNPLIAQLNWVVFFLNIFAGARAAVEANEGQRFRYRVNLRVLP